MKHSELLLQVLIQQNLSLKIKGHVTSSLSILFSYDKKNQLRPAFQKHCQELFDNNSNIQAACYLFDSLMHSLDLNAFNIGDNDWINAFIKKGKDISLAFSQVPLSNKENFEQM